MHSCSMTSQNLTPHTVATTVGTLSSDIAQTKINAFCNDSGGYEIYAIGQSNNEDGNTDMISDFGSDYNIKTGIATSGDTSAWAMKLTAGTGTGTVTTPPTIDNNFNNYHEIPSTMTMVAHRDSATSLDSNTAVTGSYLTTMYRIYTSPRQVATNYNGQVRYAMFHPNDNQGLTTLEDAFVNAGVAKVTNPTDGKQYYTMQSLTPEICSATKVHGEASQIQLLDIRDNKLYWVTKTMDEHCWMTQNLDLNLDSSVALTSENTDLNVIDSGAYNTGYTKDETTGIISWKPTRSTINATNNMTTTGTSGAISGWGNGNSTPYSADVGNVYHGNSSSCNFLTTACPDAFNKTAYSINGEHGHIGNYYNWSAAIASNNSSSRSTSTYSGNTQDNPENSICPKGWRLPIIDTYSSSAQGFNDFANVNNRYNSGRTNTDAGLIAAPLYFTRSGLVNGGSLNNSGSNGYYWSSTVGSSSFAYDLVFLSSSVDLANLSSGYGGGRHYGFSVRCVLGG